ncbi:MAG: hypothetical protein HY301_15285 [Verrucomicrobia bacterium]|nr:hypothetical protein [Verrucomicrobiota bacterium]
MCKRSLIATLALAILSTTTATVFAAKEKSEDQLIADLASPKDSVVADAMLHLEKAYPTSTKAIAAIKKYLSDPREKVRRKAARVLGALHTPVTDDELKAIGALLKGSDPQEVMDGLKALRGLDEGKKAMPEILALLKHANVGVIRDAARTVAMLGTKANVADLEPLLKHPDAKVQKDAQDAIFALKNK